ncbi:MAG: STAS domain-containing protein [Candidatus Acidiferrales bacterium]
MGSPVFDISERQVGSVTILFMVGPLTSTGGKPALIQKINAVVGAGRAKLLLDCSGVNQIDSEGIEALVRGLTTAQKKGGTLKLLNLTPPVQRVLTALAMMKVFETFTDEAAALASFS